MFCLSQFFLSSCGESSAVLIQKANAALESNDIAAARQLYQRVILRAPESPDAIEGLLKAAIITGAADEQIQWSNELLKFRPWHRQANIIVGKSLMQDGNLKDAAIRLILAYQNSAFQNEKQEAQDLLEEIAWLAQEQYIPKLEPKQEQENDSTQQPSQLQ